MSHTQEEALNLLGYLVLNHLYAKPSPTINSNFSGMIYEGAFLDDTKQLWSLFSSNAVKPTNASIKFLSLCLRHTKLPDKLQFQASIACTGIEQDSNNDAPSSDHLARSKYPLRMYLLDWLLPGPTENVEDYNEDQRKIDDPSQNLDVACLSEVFVLLALREPRLFVAEDLVVKSSMYSRSDGMHGANRGKCNY